MTLFPKCEWLKVLPDETPVDPLQDAFLAQLLAQTKLGMYANVEKFSAREVHVRAEDRRVPVYVQRKWTPEQMMHPELTKPEDWVPDPIPPHGGIELAFQQYGVPAYLNPIYPQQDSDSALAVYSWSFTFCTEINELWRYRIDPHTGRIFCSNGGRKISPWLDTYGYYHDHGWVNSYTRKLPFDYEQKSMGVTAAGIPLGALVITREDLERGYCDHPIGVAFLPGRWSRPWWPAQKGDSANGPALCQGMRARLPSDVRVPAGADILTACAIRTMRTYGYIYVDQCGGKPSYRVLPEAAGLLTGIDRNILKTTIPWEKSILIPENFRRP